jgi:hypothetical protein
MNPPVELSHDAFSRHSVIRERVPAGVRQAQAVTCAWCGGVNARGGLFRYGISPDAGRSRMGVRMFCSKSCWQSYER